MDWLSGILGAGGAGLDLGIGMFRDKKAYDRQKRLRATAHQAEVEDLRKAGLNPILSGMGGQGAITPNVGSSGKSEAFQKAVSTARDIKLMNAQLENLEADTDLKDAQNIVQQFMAAHEGVKMEGTVSDNVGKALTASLYGMGGEALVALEKAVPALAPLLKMIPKTKGKGKTAPPVKSGSGKTSAVKPTGRATDRRLERLRRRNATNREAARRRNR